MFATTSLICKKICNFVTSRLCQSSLCYGGDSFMAKNKPGAKPGRARQAADNSNGTTEKEESKGKHVKGKKTLKKGKKYDGRTDWEQLSSLGLKIIPVSADGNCFFRAIADQLMGCQDLHGELRQRVVAFLERHEPDFAPFVEDDVPFPTYCQNMREDGAWGGNMELQAVSQLMTCNICVHRFQEPRWNICNFDNPRVRWIHVSAPPPLHPPRLPGEQNAAQNPLSSHSHAVTLHSKESCSGRGRFGTRVGRGCRSYHDGEHYNSVRQKDDVAGKRTQPITFEEDHKKRTTLPNKGGREPKIEDRDRGGVASDLKVRRVSEGSDCTDIDRLRKLLLAQRGDADPAIESMTAAETEEAEVCGGMNGHHRSPSAGLVTADYEKLRSELSEILSRASHPPQAESESTANVNSLNSALTKAVKIGRNQTCPCGSKKKHKACCGVTAVKGHQFSVGSKDIKDKNGGKKKGWSTRLDDEDSVTDVGSLCI